MQAKQLADIVEAMKGVRPLIAGDAIIDHYVFGTCTRICPEAPVPVFQPQREEDRHGGMGNVKAQLDALCAPAWQWHAKKVSRKTRIMVDSHLLLRIDEDHQAQPDQGAMDALTERLQQGVEKADIDVIVLSDYAKGWLTHEACKRLIDAGTELDVPVIVDPKGRSWSKYSGCSIICPNLAEFAMWDGGDFSAVHILQKCGANGLRLLTDPAGGDAKHFPAKARHPVDVTGAGDTVVAVLAAALGAGATVDEACELANLAAGWVVGEIGTAVCPPETLIARIGEHHSRTLQ